MNAGGGGLTGGGGGLLGGGLMNAGPPGFGGSGGFYQELVWNLDDRLGAIIDSRYGNTDFRHDERGRLYAEKNGDRVQFRAPDESGNLYKTPDRTDRSYAAGGRLREDGRWLYAFDRLGFLIQRYDREGTAWHYKWDAAGNLSEVVRPDGARIAFAYDALGRRLSKKVIGVGEGAAGAAAAVTETRWIWSGNEIVHELREGAPVVTWYHEPDEIGLVGRFEGSDEGGVERRFSVVGDHLGTPTAIYDEAGRAVWSMQLDLYGVPREGRGEERAVGGDRGFCPWRWPGQYEDLETGLYYNRFRYYDPGLGQYVSKDPLGLFGGFGFFSYVDDTCTWIDPHGLLPWKNPVRQGHHLVPKHKAVSPHVRGELGHLASETATPTYFPKPAGRGGVLHQALHRAQAPHVGRKGPWKGTAQQLLEAAGRGLKGLRMRGDLKIPGTREVIARNVTPAQAYRQLLKWLEKKSRTGCGS
jgi:RHS repeat-associated protein